MRSFALIVTAESYSQAERPSELVLFWNDRITDPQIGYVNIHFDGFDPAPRQDVPELRSVTVRSGDSVELKQAEVVYRLAGKFDAQEHAPVEYAQATHYMNQARQAGASGKNMQKAARSAFSAGSRAVAKARKALALLQMEQDRDRWMSQSRKLTAELETARAEISRLSEAVRRLEGEKNRTTVYARELEEQRAGLREVIAELELQLSDLRKEKQQVEQGLESVQHRNRALQDRLLQALSTVAETRQTERGFVVKLPDIIFDVGRDSLKPDAKTVLAKLAGILLIMREHNLRIEGHTDSTGSDEINLELSQKRAEAVADFLAGQGIDFSRMQTRGYGKLRPIADNRSAEGRRRNRRVEIIIAEGEILESNP